MARLDSSLILCLLPLAALPARAAEMVEYSNDDKGFSLQHPADWKQVPPDRSNMVVNIVSPAENDQDLFFEKLNVMVLDMGQEADINELVDQIKPSLSAKLPGYKELTDEKATVAGQPARKLAGELQSQGATVRSTQWLFCAGQRLYIVTFTALASTEEKYKPAAAAMLESLTLKK